MTEIEPEVLTEDEAAELTKTSRRKWAKARLDGEPLFPCFLVAGAPRYLRSEILRVIGGGTAFKLPLAMESAPVKRGRGRPRMHLK